MARSIHLEPHLTTEELQQRYKAAPRAADARRYQALWLISQGQTAKAAAQLVGLSEKWVRTLVQRYNHVGVAGLRDQRTDNPGAAPLLTPAQFTALEQALQSAPSDGGLWTGRKVAAWVARETGITTYPQRGWVYLRRLGFTPQTPRPRHAQAATEAEQTAWKKNLQQRVNEATRRNPEATVEVWAQDEARLGLKPILRKVWARRGQRPSVEVHPRYEWLYAYGFVRPATGQTYWLILPTVNTAAMTLALAEFARDIGAGSDKHILLVLDNAGWHGSQALVVPAGIELVYLPAATPELQPAERLWPLVREGVANHPFDTLDALQDVLVERCLQLAAQPDVIRSLTHYHWFPSC